MTLPVLVINRDRDTERWAGSLAAARGVGVEPERVPAVDAHDPGFRFADHADLIATHFWGRDTIKPGAVGCFLSHRRAWARVVEAGWPAALILEDDADLVRGSDMLGEALARTRDDVLFANDRLAEWARAVDADAPVMRMDRLIAGLSGKGGLPALNLAPAPGADAYAVTRRGAERLLALTAELRIVCGVDWAMIWLALGAEVPVAGIHALGVLRGVLGEPVRRLGARVLTAPVTRRRGGPSVIVHRIERPIAGLLEG